MAGIARGREEIFPVSSLSSIQWKESQENPLLPAGSREERWAAASVLWLLQVSEPSAPGALRAREGPCFVGSCWQAGGLLQTCFLRDPASCHCIISSLCHPVSSRHVRLGSFSSLRDSQASLGRDASGQALWGQGDGCLLRIQRGRGHEIL